MRRHAHHPRRPGHNPNAPMRPGTPGSRHNARSTQYSRGRSKRQNNDAFQSFIAAFDGDMRVYAGIAAFIVFMFLIYLLGILAESVMSQLPLQ